MKSPSLTMAKAALIRTRFLTKIALIIPLPMIVFIYWGLGLFQAQWYKDPFMLLMYAVFVFGQLFAGYQYLLLVRGSRRAESVINALEMGPIGDAKQMLLRLSTLVSCHLRDLGERMYQLASRDPNASLTSLLDNAGMRRSQRENKIITLHVSINRTQLKLGFLGTLIGLLMTFPPMKSAILALRESDGEMRFVTDIAKAIDGDHFAIYTTLLATAVSTLIELVTIQVLERLLGKFELANSYVDEWTVAELEPALRQAGREAALPSSQVSAAIAQATSPEQINQILATHVGAINDEVVKGVGRLADSVSTMGRQLESALAVQSEIGRRVDRLLHYEAEIRGAAVTRNNAEDKG